MTSSLQALRDKRRKNGGISNGNCQDLEEDPQCLLKEFLCVYNEKLKAIDEEFPSSLEPKCQALMEMVNDLTEQNFMLLKTVEELEKEALSRVEAFSSLAEAAKDTIQQDTMRRGIEADKSYELESKVMELQEALKLNEVHLSSCMVEIEGLTKCLSEKNSECDKLKAAKERMIELEKQICHSEATEKENCGFVKDLQAENEKLKGEACCANIRLEDVNCQLQLLKDELLQKNSLLDEIRGGTWSPSEIECLESNHLHNILMLKDELIEQLIKEEKETRLELFNDSRICELSTNVKWLESQLEQQKVILKKTIEDKDALQLEKNQTSACIGSQNKRIEELTKEIDCLTCIIREKELEIRDNSSNECYMQHDAEGKNYALEIDQQRLKRYEEQICFLKNTLSSMKKSGGEESVRIDQQIQSLQKEVDKKNCEIMKHKDQEENLKYEISLMKTYLNNQEMQWKEEATYLRCEIEKKNMLLRKYEKQLENVNFCADHEQKHLNKDYSAAEGSNLNIKPNNNAETSRLKLKLKDVQESLTAEIADKHDEIRRLKDDVKELEEKLLHSDKQTQFKDDIIKELRKEVKVGRAKNLTLKNDKAYERLVNISVNICSTRKNKVKSDDLPYHAMVESGIIKESSTNTPDLAILKKGKKKDVKVILPMSENLPLWATKNTSNKESLAEMLGLKGTPRAAMKTRIDHLTGQLEEMRTHVLSLEERLAECNLPAVISLRSRLSSAEGSLLAMCNKMDYVRRYLENLKGDEELSIKCGLEALLSELRDDVEWNRQTRRNLSLDEGTSVIVISHRSHSLPDNSLHRLISKTKSDSAVTANKQATLHSQHSLESFQECRNYVQIINELENDFEETRKAMCFLWSGFQTYAKDNGDSMLSELGDIITSFKRSKEIFADLIAEMENVNDHQVKSNFLCYNLQCLKENLMDISESLSKAQMLSNTSEIEFPMEAGDAGVKKKLSTAINDSLSIIQIIENLKSNIDTPDTDKTRLVGRNVSDVISLIKTLLEEKEKFFEKLAAVQKQQLEFSQTLINKIMEFEKGFSTYNGSAECLRKETRKLFAVILTKEKQIQKQFDEIDNLKMALSSNKYVEETTEEIDSLRKVVSNKDLQLIEKQELIHDLRSINHSLRRRQFSQSSPSMSYSTECSDNIIDKSHQLEEGLLNIKEKFSSLSSNLHKSKDKMVKFEVETKCLVDALTKVHKEITTAKESVSKNPEISLLDSHFTEAEFKVEELLHALEIFICDEQPDFNELIETIDDNIENLLDIVEFIKRSFESERLFMKSLKNENEEIKNQLNKLQNRLTVAISQQSEINESPPLFSDECETDDFGIYTKDEFIQSLQEDLCRCKSYLEKIQEEYTSLKIEKAEMEERNQKVMEELQAKVCKLQASLQNQAPEASTLFQLKCIIEQQSQKQLQFEMREKALKSEIESKNQDLEKSKSETKSLKNKLNSINSLYTNLKMKFEGAKDLIIQLQESQSEKETEIESVKNHLISVESRYTDLQVEFEDLKDYLIGHQQNISEKEYEFDKMKIQIDCQQQEIEKLSEELKIKYDQLNEMQISREISNAGINEQLQELALLKEKVVYWENLMLHLREEISERSEEAGHWLTVSNKQKENLASLIEENQILKNENNEYESEKVKLVFELETIKKELCELTEELVKNKQLIYQLNQEKEDLESEKERLIYELDTYKKEISALTGKLMKCRHLIYQLNQDKANVERINTDVQILLQEKERSIVEYNSDRGENGNEAVLYELETIKKEVCELKEELMKSRELIYQLSQEKAALENMNTNIKILLNEKERFVTENNSGGEQIEDILQEKEECLEICFLKIAQMNNFLADRDETINILVSQLKTSTMLMLDDLDYDEGKKQFCPTLPVVNIMKMSSVTQAAAYKMKLWQSLEINRRLITMVDSLQHMNYTLLEEKEKRQNFEGTLPLQNEGGN